jgi:hypothetical protein
MAPMIVDSRKRGAAMKLMRAAAAGSTRSDGVMSRSAPSAPACSAHRLQHRGHEIGLLFVDLSVFLSAVLRATLSLLLLLLVGAADVRGDVASLNLLQR